MPFREFSILYQILGNLVKENNEEKIKWILTGLLHKKWPQLLLNATGENELNPSSDSP